MPQDLRIIPIHSNYVIQQVLLVKEVRAVMGLAMEPRLGTAGDYSNRKCNTDTLTDGILTCGKGTLGCGLLCSRAATSDTSLSVDPSVVRFTDEIEESSNEPV